MEYNFIKYGWTEEQQEQFKQFVEFPATAHGRKSKLKAFLHWESGNIHDPRAEKIKSGTYTSPISLEDFQHSA